MLHYLFVLFNFTKMFKLYNTGGFLVLVITYYTYYTYRENHGAVTEMLQQTKAKVESQRKDLEEERKLGGQLKTVLREAAIALKEALRVTVNINAIIGANTEKKILTVFWIQEVPEKGNSEVPVIVRRHQMMQKLLAVLETAVAVGEAPALVEFMPAMGCSHQSTKSPNIKRYK